VIEHTTAKETDRIDSHIMLLTIETASFNVRCDNCDRISFRFVRRKNINEALTIAVYRDAIGENNKLYIMMAKNSRQMQSVGCNTTSMWSFFNHFRKSKKQKELLVYMALGHKIETDDDASVHLATSDDDMSTRIHNGTVILHFPIRNMTLMTNSQCREATQSVNNNATDFIKAVLSDNKSPLQSSLSLEMSNYTLLYFEQKKFQHKRKEVFVWEQYSPDPNIPDS